MGRKIVFLFICFVVLSCFVSSAPADQRKRKHTADDAIDDTCNDINNNNTNNINEDNNNNAVNNNNNGDANDSSDSSDSGDSGDCSDYVELQDSSDGESEEDTFQPLNEEDKSILLKKLYDDGKVMVEKPPDVKGIKRPKKCIHPDPNGVNIVRNDGITLNTGFVNTHLQTFVTASDILNNMANGCSPLHPGMQCAVHLNLEGEVYDISIVTPEKYARLKSLKNLRDSILVMNDPELYDFVPKRHPFYWEEGKICPPDRGFYREQRQAERDIAHLANFICIPTTALYPSSSHAYMRGPKGVTIIRPELPAGEQVATLYNKPYGATKWHELNHEWHDEFDGRVPPRIIQGLEKVKCVVLIEKEGFYKLASGLLARDHGCISINLHGFIVRAVVWFIRAIKVRDTDDRIKLYTMSDMDLGGLKIAHQLSKDWNEDTIRFVSRSRGDYLYLRYQTCWMGMYPSEYNRLSGLAPSSGVYKPMTMSQEVHDAIDEWRDDHQDDIAYAGDNGAPAGTIRNREIDDLLQDRILFNIAKIPPHHLSVQLGIMLNNAICPEKWSNLKSPPVNNSKQPPENMLKNNTMI